MADLYNLTNISNSDNIVQLTQQTNQVTGELFGFMILFSLFVILAISYRGQPIFARLASAGVVTTLISFLFRLIDLTGDIVVFSFVVLTTISFVMMAYTQD